MAHNVEILDIKRNKQTGGVQFTLKCCGELEYSCHLQNLALYASDEERARVIEDLKQEHAERHDKELATEEFLKNYK
ncbi:MAG: hypothetical protein M3O09_15955 [Acidobacteriota bacterium]|nr:hypothetical protein [Acidobacteriota bacterium]